MKANELMIGDYVTFRDCQNDSPVIIEIVALGFQDEGEDDCLVNIGHSKACDILELDDEIIGLPLTPEILEKNGFSSADGGWELISMTNDDNDISWTIFWTNDGGPHFHIDSYSKAFSSFTSFRVLFVHELQHALRLCGIDKEINL